MFVFFIFSHSPFDVGRSMFDVHFFQSIPGKNNLALMGARPLSVIPAKAGIHVHRDETAENHPEIPEKRH
jgi:hypothetical protein